MRNHIFAIILLLASFPLMGAGQDAGAKEIAAAYRILELLAAGEADAGELEQALCVEFDDLSVPHLQCALGMTALRQGINAAGEEKQKFLLLAEERLGNAAGKMEKDFDDIVKLELARTLLLRADSVSPESPDAPGETAVLCGRAFSLLLSIDAADRETGLERDRLAFLLCAKTGFYSGMEVYRKRIADAGGSIGDLPSSGASGKKVDGRGWILKEDPRGKGFFLDDPDGRFTAALYLLPEEEYGRKESFPEYLLAFAAPVLSRSAEGRLDIHGFTAGSSGVSGVYGVLTDRGWKPGDEKKGSHRFVTIALMSPDKGGKTLYMVLFSDFHFSAELDALLAYSAELAAGN